MVVATEAKCLTSGSFNTNFKSFIRGCRSTNDNARTYNIITSGEIVDIFVNEQASANNLLISFTGLKALLNNSNVNISTLDNLKNNLNEIHNKIDEVESKIEVENQKFLTRVTDAPKKTDYFGNLQDIALGFFFFSLFLLTIILTIIQYSKQDGSLKLALYTFIGMIIGIIVIYGLLKEVA